MRSVLVGTFFHWSLDGLGARSPVHLTATTGSTSRATTPVLGSFVVIELFWDVVSMAILYVVNGFSLQSTMPDWVFLVGQVSPSTAHLSAVIAVLPGLAETDGAASAQTGPGVEVELTSVETDPFYLSPEVGLVVLAFWFVVTFLVGNHRFNGADL